MSWNGEVPENQPQTSTKLELSTVRTPSRRCPLPARTPSRRVCILEVLERIVRCREALHVAHHEEAPDGVPASVQRRSAALLWAQNTRPHFAPIRSGHDLGIYNESRLWILCEHLVVVVWIESGQVYASRLEPILQPPFGSLSGCRLATRTLT
jgi:hypothetical protein